MLMLLLKKLLIISPFKKKITTPKKVKDKIIEMRFVKFNDLKSVRSSVKKYLKLADLKPKENKEEVAEANTINNPKIPNSSGVRYLV